MCYLMKEPLSVRKHKRKRQRAKKKRIKRNFEKRARSAGVSLGDFNEMILGESVEIMGGERWD